MKKSRIMKGIYEKGQQNRIFWFYLLTYLIVLFVPMIITCLYYINMLSLIARDDRKEKETELSHAAVLVDNRLDELGQLGDTIATNSYVNDFRNRTTVFDYPNSYRVYELCASLPDLYQMGQAIFGYFIFFDQSETVISKSAAYTYEEFYNLYLEEESYPDYESWYKHMKEDVPSYGLSSVGTYLYKRNELETKKELFYYERPLIASGGPDHSRIRIYMEEGSIEEILPVAEEGSVQLITDLTGNILYFGPAQTEEAWGEEQVGELTQLLWENRAEEKSRIRFHGESYEVIRRISGRSDLMYYMLLPQKVINGRMLSSLLILSVFLLIGSVVGVALSYHMSVLSATPINDILHSISRSTGQSGGHQTAFASLKTTFSYLVETNTRLSQAIESQMPYLRNSFINRLIYGSQATEEELRRIADNVGFPWKNRIFGTIIFQFHLLWEG